MDNDKNTSIPLAGLNSILAVLMLILIILRYLTSEVPVFFIIIFFPSISLILLSLFTCNVVNLVKNIHGRKKLLLSPFLIILLGILILLSVPFSQIKLTLNYNINISDREKIIKQIKNSELKADEESYILLPEKYKI